MALPTLGEIRMAATFQTVNVTLHASDGWVQLTAGGAANFLRVSHLPPHIPIFLATGNSAPSMTGTAGTGTFVFSTGVPLATQTIVVGSETYTFGATRTGPFTVAIGATNLITATNFTSAVNTDSTLVTASDTSGTVTLTSKVKNIGGNYATTTAATNVAAGGAALTGGTNPNAGYRDSCPSSHFDGAFTGNLYARIPNNSNGEVTVSVWQN